MLRPPRGKLGVALFQALERDGSLVPDGAGYRLAPRGASMLADLGVDVRAVGHGSRRPFARPCPDWTEHRPHLAGALGAALAERFFEAGWIRRTRDGGRAVDVTADGRDELAARLGLRDG